MNDDQNIAGELDVGPFKTRFSEAEEALQRPRQMAFRDRDYYDNFDDDQWSAYEKGVLKRRKQQAVTSNHIKRKVDFLRGFEEQSRTDPKAFPRRPDQDAQAQIATDCLTYLDSNLELDRIFSEVFDCLAVEGIQALERTWQYSDDPESDGEISVEPIPFDRFFYDPRSLKGDFSDARYMGYAEWMDVSQAIEAYGEEYRSIIEVTLEDISADAGFEDKPDISYGRKNERRVRVVVMYHNEPGKGWMLTHFTGGGVLFSGQSPYPGEFGEPSCGIIAQSCYVNRENFRYGVVRDMISLQDERNQVRTRQMHLLNDRRTWGNKGAVQDENKMKQAMARADGHVEANGTFGEHWGIIDSMGEFAGLADMLNINAYELGEEGATSALRGRGTESQSGRAILAQQQSGLTQENSLYDAHASLKKRTYRGLWFMVRKFWSGPRWVRVTGRSESAQFVSINEPIHNEYGIQTGVRNPVAKIDVDITIESTPNSLTLQHEEFEWFSKALPTLVALPPAWAKMFLKLSHFGQKDEAIAMLDEMAQAQASAAGPDPLAVEEAKRKAFETNINAKRAEAEVRNKDAQTQKARVETALMYAEGVTPEPVQQAANA